MSCDGMAESLSECHGAATEFDYAAAHANRALGGHVQVQPAAAIDELALVHLVAGGQLVARCHQPSAQVGASGAGAWVFRYSAALLGEEIPHECLAWLFRVECKDIGGLAAQAALRPAIEPAAVRLCATYCVGRLHGDQQLVGAGVDPHR